MDYPKSLYHHIIVENAEQEAEARREGYRALTDEVVERVEDIPRVPKRRGRPARAKDGGDI